LLQGFDEPVPGAGGGGEHGGDETVLPGGDVEIVEWGRSTKIAGWNGACPIITHILLPIDIAVHVPHCVRG
jgi:hypothetical protein